MKNEDKIKLGRKALKGIPHKPQPRYAVEYVATQSDLREMKAELKGDILSLRTELKGDILSLRTELKGDIKDLEIKMLATMATKVELRLLGALIVIGFTALGILIRLGH